MKDDLKYIDEFYKNRIGKIDGVESVDGWDKLRWTLFWMRYKWAIGVGSFVVLFGILSLTFYYTQSESQIEISVSQFVEETAKISETQPSESRKQKTMVVPNETEQSTGENYFKDTDDFSNTAIVGTNSPGIVAIINTSSFEKTEDLETFNDENYSQEEFALMGINSINFSSKLAQQPDTSLLGYNLRTDVLPPGARNKWFSVDVYAGSSASASVISAYNADYINFRNSNESGSMGWSVGSDLKFHYKNWIVSMGINYSAYKQNRYYNYSYEEYSPENSYFDYDTTWVYIFDPPDYGTPKVKSIDSSWVEVYDQITIDNSGVNTLKYFEIPILLGYRFNFNLMAIEINAGTSVGFLTYSQMKVPDFADKNNIVSAENMNSTMFNFIASAKIYYHLNHKTSLFVSPYYKQNLQSVFDKSYPLEQKFKTFGLNFGVSFGL